MATLSTPSKPKLRGYFHQESFFISVGACAMLIAKASGLIETVSIVVYSLGLLTMFGVSAIYHRFHWEPIARARLKRLDHSAIFVLIAATATPIAVIAMDKSAGNQFLYIMWAIASFGIVQSIFWVKAPKVVTAILYLFMGWMAGPYIPEFYQAMGGTQLGLIIAGGVVFTVGALFYAFKWPKKQAVFFGYHELFHIFTLVGAILHFIVIYNLL